MTFDWLSSALSVSWEYASALWGASLEAGWASLMVGHAPTDRSRAPRADELFMALRGDLVIADFA